jgi:hypothetical protein
MAPFIALAPELNRGGLPLRDLGKPQVPNPELRGFIGSGACIVEKQQEPIVTPPLCGATVRSTEQRIHFRFFQIGDRRLSRLFERNCPELSAPGNMLWAPLPNEARQRMDRSQSLIAGRHVTLPPLLHVLKKQPDVLGREVISLELIDQFVDGVGDKREQQHEGVAVTALGITRQIPLAHQMFQEKAPDPRAKRGGVSHVPSPQKHIVESVATLPGATLASSSGTLAWRRG